MALTRSAIVGLLILMTVSHPTLPAASAVPSVERGAGEPLRLDNGLQIVWEEDHRQPLVAIEARIKGGVRGEGVYLGTGMTHFMEHMLFKGTTSRAPGTIDQEVRRYGGTINAFTSLDATGVTLFVESKHLREALAMLADILQHAVFDPKEFNKERAVILSEIQMNEDDPDRRLSRLFWERHFLEHPYRAPILGHPPLLQRLTVNDMAAFYAAQYQPQHVTLACVGDLDGAALPGLMTELFGGWPRGRGDGLQQVVAQEPPAASAKRASVRMPVQSAYVLLGFPSVRLADPDLYALDVLAAILGRGQSSRLYEPLVRVQRVAHTVSAWNYTPYDPGVFGIQLRTDAGQVPAAAAAALAIIETLKERGVTDTELRKAKRQVTADYLFGLQTVEGKAADLANSLSATGDPLFSRRYVERIAEVTAAHVQAAARRYVTPQTMTTATVEPLAEAVPPAAGTRVGTLLTAQHRLDSDATALIGVDPTLPIAAVVVAFHGGVRVETEATQGLSNLVAQMLTKGTARKSAVQIAQAVESLGGTLEPFSGRDGFGIVLQLLSEDVPKGIALAHELVTEAAFDERELQTQRQLITKELAAQEDEIFEVGGRLLRKTLFSRHPYRWHPLGEKTTVEGLTRAQCRQFASQWLVPSNMVVSVFGAVEQADTLQRLQATFGAMPKRTAAWPSQLPEEPLGGVREAASTMDRQQVLIMLGFRGTTAAAADRDALDVLTAVLSGMSGRLFQSVRERHGLSYALGAVHVPAWDPGYLLVYAATKLEERSKVLTVLEEQLQLAAANGFTAEEVDQAKRYLIGQHRMDVQHLVGLAKRAALDELYGVGFDAWKTYEQRIGAITPQMVEAAAKRYLTMAQRAQIVISPNGHLQQGPQSTVHSPP
ncbi:MAG: insulinase family protein [Candidatus Omnitrophica bacterium]|nr:insulinase family protein [Candidatus Omnitrophota bacterium]